MQLPPRMTNRETPQGGGVFLAWSLVMEAH
jgi:hypothetical protein